jgi:hypothetical protein
MEQPVAGRNPQELDQDEPPVGYGSAVMPSGAMVAAVALFLFVGSTIGPAGLTA